MFGFFHGKFRKFLKMHLSVQVSKTLGILIVWTFTTHISNHLINFPMCTECKKGGQKPVKRAIAKDQNSFTLFVQNNKIISINNNNLPPSLDKLSPADRKQGINKCWPYMATVVIIVNGRSLGIGTRRRH